LSATEAGLALTAATISWTAGAWIQARGATRWPTHLFVRVGFAVTPIGLAAGFALAVLIGLGGLVLTGRLRPRTVPAASLAMASAPPQS